MEIKKMFYTMGEVSEMFDVNPSLIRHWEGYFDIIKPQRNKKGNRLFTAEDVENLRLIYHYVKERGMTLEGAKRSMKQKKSLGHRDAELLERLQRVRSLLVDVREELKEEQRTPTRAAAQKRTKDSDTNELFSYYEQSLFY